MDKLTTELITNRLQSNGMFQCDMCGGVYPYIDIEQKPKLTVIMYPGWTVCPERENKFLSIE